MTYGLLALAIAVELMATLALRASQGFTRLVPTVLVLGGYSFAFFLLAVVLRRGLDVAVVYAVWSAVGIVLLALIGTVFLHEGLTAVQALGIILIVGGVLALELGARGHP